MTAGYRSPEGLWIGGISADVDITVPTGGYQSLMAFWLGGVCAVTTTPVPPVPVVIMEEARRWPGPPIVIYRETDVIPAWQRKREDDEIIIL